MQIEVRWDRVSAVRRARQFGLVAKLNQTCKKLEEDTYDYLVFYDSLPIAVRLAGQQDCGTSDVFMQFRILLGIYEGIASPSSLAPFTAWLMRIGVRYIGQLLVMRRYWIGKCRNLDIK